MKALLTLSFCCTTLLVFGQWSNLDLMTSDAEVFIPAPRESLYLQRYRSVFLGIGPRYLNTDPGQIVTNFVDDSPSMDSFNATFEVKDGYVQPAINFGYKGGGYRGPSHDYLFDVTLGKNYTAKFAYSWGWNFLTKLGEQDLVLRPAIQGLIANSVFALGSIQNNAAYIQIGNTQYFENELEVELRAQSATIAPRFDVTYIVADRWDFFFKAAYDIPTGNINPSLEFRVPERLQTEDSPGASSLDIDGANPSVTYNGEKLEELPYRTGGLRISFGVSFLWNR